MWTNRSISFSLCLTNSDTRIISIFPGFRVETRFICILCVFVPRFWREDVINVGTTIIGSRKSRCSHFGIPLHYDQEWTWCDLTSILSFHDAMSWICPYCGPPGLLVVFNQTWRELSCLCATRLVHMIWGHAISMRFPRAVGYGFKSASESRRIEKTAIFFAITTAYGRLTLLYTYKLRLVTPALRQFRSTHHLHFNFLNQQQAAHKSTGKWPRFWIVLAPHNGTNSLVHPKLGLAQILLWMHRGMWSLDVFLKHDAMVLPAHAH